MAIAAVLYFIAAIVLVALLTAMFNLVRRYERPDSINAWRTRLADHLEALANDGQEEITAEQRLVIRTLRPDEIPRRGSIAVLRSDALTATLMGENFTTEFVDELNRTRDEKIERTHADLDRLTEDFPSFTLVLDQGKRLIRRARWRLRWESTRDTTPPAVLWMLALAGRGTGRGAGVGFVVGIVTWLITRPIQSPSVDLWGDFITWVGGWSVSGGVAGVLLAIVWAYWLSTSNAAALADGDDRRTLLHESRVVAGAGLALIACIVALAVVPNLGADLVSAFLLPNEPERAEDTSNARSGEPIWVPAGVALFLCAGIAYAVYDWRNSESSPRWERLRNLSGCALFLGFPAGMLVVSALVALPVRLGNEWILVAVALAFLPGIAIAMAAGGEMLASRRRRRERLEAAAVRRRRGVPPSIGALVVLIVGWGGLLALESTFTPSDATLQQVSDEVDWLQAAVRMLGLPITAVAGLTYWWLARRRRRRRGEEDADYRRAAAKDGIG